MKVIRYGFPIAPDFGGTTHAYCGSTMSVTLGDLLQWDKKPTLEDMLRAYIIRSRIKEADKIMLAQPLQSTTLQARLITWASITFGRAAQKDGLYSSQKKVGRYRQNNWPKENYQVKHFAIGVVFWLLPNIFVNDLSDVHVVA